MSHTAPLEAIHRKEAELTRRLEEARRQAEADEAAARAAARQRLARAETEGAAEADRLYRDGIAQAERQAAELVAGAQTRAKLLRRQAHNNLADAAKRLVQLVLQGQRPC